LLPPIHTCGGIRSEERKGGKSLFLFTAQLLRKTNLDPIFSESRSGTIAHKNQKRITSDTQSERLDLKTLHSVYQQSAVLDSYYLSMHSWPSPPIFLPIAVFVCCFVPPFWVSFHSLHKKASFAQKSLSRQKFKGKIGKIYTFLTCGQLNPTPKKIAVQIPHRVCLLSKYTCHRGFRQNLHIFILLPFKYHSKKKSCPNPTPVLLAVKIYTPPRHF
jgi:hypothetical protein